MLVKRLLRSEAVAGTVGEEKVVVLNGRAEVRVKVEVTFALRGS